ncbi:MAG: hypothetical protein A2033_02350 [Bacteroidetes bacterium GWA2_31_9]|nr:MAG: hypothetical protein A2033_02350 [Bacteroidetes bacterium GWA2_31_9]
MIEIIKTFKFEAEKVVLSVNINKELYGTNTVRMFVDAELVSNNNKIVISISNNGKSVNTYLLYHSKSFFWMKYNPHQGFWWESKNQLKNEYFHSVKEMQEKYILIRDIIPDIASYFYECIKKLKNTIILFETNIKEIE